MTCTGQCYIKTIAKYAVYSTVDGVDLEIQRVDQTVISIDAWLAGLICLQGPVCMAGLVSRICSSGWGKPTGTLRTKFPGAGNRVKEGL